MTVKQIVSSASGNKPFERFHQSGTSGSGYYGGHGNYGYPPVPTYHGPPSHPPVIKHYSYSQSSSGGGRGGSVALSALTLLSFLFFLNILQQCLKDQMMSMTPQMMVMTSGREDTVQGKNDKLKRDDETKTFTLVGGVGRVYPVKLSLSERIQKSNARNHNSDMVFVNAMDDDIGEMSSTANA